MRFGVSVGNGAAYGEGESVDACLDVARRAEARGFDSVWVHDHVVLPREPRTPYPYDASVRLPFDADFHEPLVLLSALAAVTSRVQLGTSVLVIPYRHPAVTAKMFAAIDGLSEGRAVLGIGVGWMRDEFEALGLSEAHFERRGAVTDDYLRAIKEMWTNTGPSYYRGDWVSFENVGTFPKPVRKPHPPIVVGGKGRHALRRASLLGDGFQALSSTVDELRREVEELRRVCRADRRDADELEVQLAGIVVIHERPLEGERPPLQGSVEQILDDLVAYARVGLDHLLAMPMFGGAERPFESVRAAIDIFGDEVIPALRGRA